MKAATSPTARKTEEAVCGRPPARMLVLAEEARQPREPAMASAPMTQSPVGDLGPVLQPAHLAHVLLTAHGVDHRAGAEEEEPLKKPWATRWKMPAVQAPTPGLRTCSRAG